MFTYSPGQFLCISSLNTDIPGEMFPSTLIEKCRSRFYVALGYTIYADL